MKITRAKIVDIIFNRLNKAITKKQINIALKTICQTIVDDLVDGNTVDIKNFGSFIPYIFHGHKGYNVSTKQVEYIKPKYEVKLKIHPKFQEKLMLKREKFSLLKKNSSNS